MAYLDAIDEYVEQLREQDMIEPSGGPWCSNIVVVRKKDGRLRLCVDYRGLNARTYYDSCPLPNIEGTLDALGGSSWFFYIRSQKRISQRDYYSRRSRQNSIDYAARNVPMKEDAVGTVHCTWDLSAAHGSGDVWFKL